MEPPELLIDDATLDRLAKDLSEILDHVKELEKVDTSKVPASAHGVPLPTMFRDDVPVTPTEPDKLLAAAPQRAGDAICVPRIVE